MEELKLIESGRALREDYNYARIISNPRDYLLPNALEGRLAGKGTTADILFSDSDFDFDIIYDLLGLLNRSLLTHCCDVSSSLDI